jgi:hypothetical protein
VIVDPGGTVIVVLFAGGRGLLLLKERHPLSANGSNKTNGVRRMWGFLRGTGKNRSSVAEQSSLTKHEIVPPRQLSPTWVNLDALAGFQTTCDPHALRIC